MRITRVFEVDRVAQLFTPCYKTLARKTIFISVVNAVPISLLILWMSDWLNWSSWERKDHPFKQVHLSCVQILLHQHWFRTVHRCFCLHTNCGSLVYVLRFQWKKHSRKFQRSKTHRILYVHFTVVICGVYVWKLARNTCFLFNDVSVCVWFVGFHVRAQSLHSSFPFPAKHGRMCQGAGVELFVFQRSRKKSSAQARQCWDT